jgi:hypothetical protein
VLFPAPGRANDGGDLSRRDGQRQILQHQGPLRVVAEPNPLQADFVGQGRPRAGSAGNFGVGHAFAVDRHQVFKGGELAEEGLQLVLPAASRG